MFWIWIGFILFVLLMLALDLGVFHRKAHAVSVKEAIVWSSVWISLALIFNVILYFWQGPKPAMEFLAGFLIEKSLSVDNLFVFLLIFKYFHVPRESQHRILFWGVIGALISRGFFIWGGITLLHHFQWMNYVFGAILIYTGIKISLQSTKEVDPEANRIFQFFKRVKSPMLAVLLVVETTDIIFAIDSIPAIFAITLDPFIVFTSNVFAILGLRSLYFALSGAMEKFHRLDIGLAAILTFVGVKMIIADWYHVPTWLSLSIILVFLMAAVAASQVWPEKDSE